MPDRFFESIRGRRLGLNERGDLVGKGDRIMASYDPLQRPTVSTDFLGLSLDTTRFRATGGSDGSVVAGSITAAADGLLRSAMGAGAGASMSANGIQIDSQLNWKAANGTLVCQVRLKMVAITSICLYVGFTDQISALEMPIQGSGSANGITTNATDACGFLFDTGMTTGDWWCVGVANDTDATSVDSAVAPVADTFVTLRVEIDTAGTANYFINGSKVGSVALAVTTTVTLTPVVAGFTKSAASKTIATDYIHAEQDIR